MFVVSAKERFKKQHVSDILLFRNHVDCQNDYLDNLPNLVNTSVPRTIQAKLKLCGRRTLTLRNSRPVASRGGTQD